VSVSSNSCLDVISISLPSLSRMKKDIEVLELFKEVQLIREAAGEAQIFA